MRRLRWLALSFGIVPALLAQQEKPAAPGDTVEWHVIEPGDTLEGLTAKYLGDPELWRDNWRLNPDLKDPHTLRPGQRILIIVKRQARSAEIAGLSRKVESKPHPDPAWAPAKVGELLRVRDGLRTYAKSSADLLFEDGSRLVVTEDSLVFLRETGARLVGEVQRRAIEIVEGQAEVQSRPMPKPPAGIEILVGGARATALPQDDGMGTRARKSASGGAQVMVYVGTSEVASGGQSVVVPKGMGTNVPKGGRPSAPEALLPAPQILAPIPKTAYGQSNPRFSWRPVEGASSYTVEVCVDEGCGQVVDRATRVRGTRWSPDGLPLGPFHVRVMAVSASGLDGFPSGAVPFQIDSLWRRPDPSLSR